MHVIGWQDSGVYVYFAFTVDECKMQRDSAIMDTCFQTFLSCSFVYSSDGASAP